MQLLIGVAHCEEFLDKVVDVISAKYQNGIESLMLEIPQNWSEIKDNYVLYEDFFLRLAQEYRKHVRRIIFGAPPINTSKNTTWDLLIDAFVSHKSDKSMVRTVRDENPQVAIVGLSHANYLKKRFPGVYYVAFSVVPYDKIDGFFVRLLGKPYKPDEVISVKHALPEEYYYQKYGID